MSSTCVDLTRLAFRVSHLLTKGTTISKMNDGWTPNRQMQRVSSKVSSNMPSSRAQDSYGTLLQEAPQKPDASSTEFQGESLNYTEEPSKTYGGHGINLVTEKHTEEPSMASPDEKPLSLLDSRPNSDGRNEMN